MELSSLMREGLRKGISLIGRNKLLKKRLYTLAVVYVYN